MSEYLDKICPFCKTKFLPDDEVVVCSECDMPHHKDCWIENQGCTTFGCLGTIDTPDGQGYPAPPQMSYSAPSAPSSATFCTNCGARNDSSATFCVTCGNRVAPAPAPAAYAPPRPVAPAAPRPVTPPVAPSPVTPPVAPPSAPSPYVNPNPYYGGNPAGYTASSYSDSVPHYGADVDVEVQQLIGPNQETYVPKFRELKSGKSPVSWNWTAFFLAPFWMMYRKMYAYAAAWLGINSITQIISTEIMYHSYSGISGISMFFSSLSAAMFVAFGLFGNFIYMKFLETKAKPAKTMTEPYKSRYLADNGGVNVPAVVFTAIGYAMFSLILMSRGGY